jgi:uncharacterized protein (DUF983 family)
MRERNGWIDNGTPIKGARHTCPNCGSYDYIETVSREECFSCGLLCDYWGNGTNDVYNNYCDRMNAIDDDD